MRSEEASRHTQDSSVVTAFFGGQSIPLADEGLPGCVWRCHISSKGPDMLRWFKVAQ